MLARDRALEGWLREQVAPAYDALKADPSRAVSADDVRATLWPNTRRPPKNVIYETSFQEEKDEES